MAPGPGRLAERDRVSKGSSAPTPRAWKRRANRCEAALWSSWPGLALCQKQAPAAGPRRTCRLAEAGPVSHASARPPHVLVPAPGRLRPRARPGSDARRRAAASPPPGRSLRAARRGPVETPRPSPRHPLRGVWYAGRPSRRATPFAFVPGSLGPGMDSRGPERDRIPGSTCGSTCAPRARQGRGAEVSGCCERKAGGHLAGRARGAGRLLRTVGALRKDASISVHTSSKPAGDVV